MFPTTSFTTLLLSLSVAANPVLIDGSPITLSISRRTNFTSVHNLLRHDQTRAKFLKAKGAARAAGISLDQDAVVNEEVYNQAVDYVAYVSVGSPATTYKLLIDTGSSNTWVGADKGYTKTSTSIRTPDTVSLSYGSGSFSGTEYIDTVTLASGLVIPKQSIGVASRTAGFSGIDGVLGIGPVDLTIGTLSPATNALVPTVTDNLFVNKVISANQIGISFNPTTVENNRNGELTWGGVDPARFTGTFTFIPLTTTAPASEYWGINQSVRYGASTSILATTAGIVDTGTTLVLLATDGFRKYKTATRATHNDATGLLKVTTANFNALQSLFFTAGGAAFELTPNAQIWPRALNTDIGGTTGSIYLIVSDLGSSSGEGLDFINGFAFLERFYTVFDTANKRVGFATTPFTKSTVN